MWLVFILSGVIGSIVFIYAARTGRKIWPLWLAGVGVILGGGVLLFVWMNRGPGSDLGGLGLALFMTALWAGSGIAALILAAILALVFKQTEAADN